MKTLPNMSVNINGDLGVADWRSDPAKGMTQRLTLEEKREIARRTNAYPALIQALRLENVNDKGEQRQNTPIAALLGELGEAELPIWQQLNAMSHRFGYDSPEAKVLDEAAQIVKSSAGA